MAAMDFPSSPTNGQVANGYTYDSAKGAWRKNAAITVSVTTSAVAPSNPNPGDQWLYTNEGTLFTWWSDGTSSQWVQSSSVIANADPNPMPAGSIMAWGGATAPQNWLLCDGSAVSRSTYASLFAAIGTQYGTGDGSTTFNLPNLKGRTVVGRDSTQTEFDALGESGGAKTHTLTEAEMPSHTHIQNSHNHTQDSHNHTQNAHSHNFVFGGTQYAGLPYSTGFASSLSWTAGNAAGASQTTISSVTATNIATTATNQPTTATNQNTGGGGAHNNLQPYIVLNYIIKASAGITPGDSVLTTRVGTLETRSNATPQGPNYIINGAMDVWQRGTSVTLSSTQPFGPDRWRYNNSRFGPTANVTVTQQAFTLGSSPASGIKSYTRISGNEYQYPGDYAEFSQRIEDVTLLAGKTVAVSFWANFSSAGRTVSIVLSTGNVSGGSSASVTATVTSVSGWNRYTTSVTLPSLSGSTVSANNYFSLAVRFPFLNAGENVYLEFTGVQLEEGAITTPFRRNAPSIQAELAACQRYYFRWTSGTSYSAIGLVLGAGGGIAVMAYQFPTTMRVTPTSIDTSVGASFIANNWQGYSDVSPVTMTLSTNSSPHSGWLSLSGTAFASNRDYMLTSQPSYSGGLAYIGFSAEL